MYVLPEDYFISEFTSIKKVKNFFVCEAIVMLNELLDYIFEWKQKDHTKEFKFLFILIKNIYF